MAEETNALPTGYSLHRYQIEGVLGAGGFGITYKAMHEALENEVAIKEYFPAEWAYRDHNGTTVRANSQGQIPARSGEPPCYEWGLQRFLDEAKILVQINHPGVVRVRDYFTMNGSAYIVMEYEEGESLSTSLQRGGILPEPDLIRLLGDVLPALEAVHAQGYLHRDLKPSNLYVRKNDNRVILIDFGAARQALGRRTRSVTSVVTPGYSPIEQYVTVGDDYGPWTDLYALGAVLYRCITGAPPIEAPGRVLKDPVHPAIEVGAGLYSRGLLYTVDQALAVRPEDRFQSVAAMRESLQTTDSANALADFSQLPPIDSAFLDLPSPMSAARFGSAVARSESSAPSTRENWLGGVNSLPDRPPALDRSRPSPRPDSRPATGGASSPDWTLSDRAPPLSQPERIEMRSVTPLTTPADAALPLLENVWDHLDEFTLPSAPSQPNAAEIEVSSQPQSQPRSQPRSQPSASLLNRSPQSAVAYLKKAAPSRRNSVPSVYLPDAPASTPIPVDRSEPTSAPRSPVVDSGGTVRSIHWTRVLLTVFAISGLSGTGILAYEYFKTFQEQHQQATAAQQQQETAQRGEEETQRREAEIAGHIDQARRAITNKNWALADHYLNRAATLNPGHLAIATVRTELLVAQQPSANTKTRTDPITGLELSWVEGGCFSMGSPATERDRNSDETSHQVCVKGFWIGKTEITNSQYRRFKPGHNSGVFQGLSLNGDTQPAVNLNWNDTIAFAEWLSWEAGAGKRFRLPTEAEWERAARAGTTTRYYWGNDIDPRYANFSDRNDPTGASIGSLDDGQAITAPVGSYPSNALDVRDMAGNVWEWTCSEYDPNYSGAEQRCSTRRSNEGQRVVRGGSWSSGAGELRSARRLPRKPSYQDAMTGFRVIMEE